ncbi:hypothetical protein ACQPZX_12745 [Actinoplanes sp. CA-142083]|uniref:hypothetical protein n=1 Tax=Actinoplanes sp. CA-142083 TaxID=3239903 RepID=UPI003D918B3D
MTGSIRRSFKDAMAHAERVLDDAERVSLDVPSAALRRSSTVLLSGLAEYELVDGGEPALTLLPAAGTDAVGTAAAGGGAAAGRVSGGDVAGGWVAGDAVRWGGGLRAGSRCGWWR